MTELIYSDRRAMKVTQIFVTNDDMITNRFVAMFTTPGVKVTRVQEFHGGAEFLVNVELTKEGRAALERKTELKQLYLYGSKKSYTIADIAKLAEG